MAHLERVQSPHPSLPTNLQAFGLPVRTPSNSSASEEIIVYPPEGTMSIEPEVHDPLFHDPLEQYNYIAGQINALNLIYENLGSPTRFVPTALVDNPILKTTPNNNPFIEAMSQGLDKGKQPEGSGSGRPVPPDDNPTSTTLHPRALAINEKFKAKVPDDYTR